MLKKQKVILTKTFIVSLKSLMNILESENKLLPEGRSLPIFSEQL